MGSGLMWLKFCRMWFGLTVENYDKWIVWPYWTNRHRACNDNSKWTP